MGNMTSMLGTPMTGTLNLRRSYKDQVGYRLSRRYSIAVVNSDINLSRSVKFLTYNTVKHVYTFLTSFPTFLAIGLRHGTWIHSQ